MEFPPYTSSPKQVIKGNKTIADFINEESATNADQAVINSFGEEWSKFKKFDVGDLVKLKQEYFDIFPEELKNKTSKILDVGCGTGRWTKVLCNDVGLIDAVDPSQAIMVADELLAEFKNIRLTKATTETLPFADNSYDFVMSIGVLHHIPDTLKAMKDCVTKVKNGGYFYAYLYYSLDNKGLLFKSLFRISDLIRKVISRLPPGIKRITCEVIAILFYMPFILLSRMLYTCGLKKMAVSVPLSTYRDKTFFIIRNDALDRFGTRLEQRFSRKEIQQMMEKCGLSEIRFSENAPYWHVTGKKQ